MLRFYNTRGVALYLVCRRAPFLYHDMIYSRPFDFPSARPRLGRLFAVSTVSSIHVWFRSFSPVDPGELA